MLHRISAIAMVSGFATNFVVSSLVTLLGAFVVDALGLSAELGSADLQESLATDAPLVAVILLAASGSAFAAGYAAAVAAPGDEAINALVLGLLLMGVNAAGYAYSGVDPYPLWYAIPAFAVTVPLSLFGGLVRRGPPPHDGSRGPLDGGGFSG